MRLHCLRAPTIVFAAALLAGGASSATAQHGRPSSIPDRARGAERIIVGRIVRADAIQQVNAHGDQLIVSRAVIQVEESMKGAPIGALQVDVEGGTLNGITMNVSDIPTVRAGERAVFFLDRGSAGNYVPHWRGLGIVELDARSVAQESGLRLDQIRALVAGAGR